MFILTELGSRLKEARLSKGYSLDDLQELTKIQKRYLQAIEEGNYSIMPGTFYARAFIKQYAEAMDLDAEQLLETFQGEIPGAPVEQVTQSMSTSPSRRKSTKGPSNKLLEAMPKYIVALFIIVIIVFVAFLFQKKTNEEPGDLEEDSSAVQIDKQPTPVQPEEEKPAVNEENPTETEEPAEPEVTQTISEGTLESDGETTTYTLTGAKELKIRIETSGPTWVGVRDYETQTELSTTTDKLFNAGEVAEVDATAVKQVRIRLGASQNAKVFINDELLQYATTDRTTQNIVIIFNKEQ